MNAHNPLKIKCLIWCRYAERIADIQKEVRELDELIKNPTRA